MIKMTFKILARVPVVVAGWMHHEWQLCVELEAGSGQILQISLADV